MNLCKTQILLVNSSGFYAATYITCWRSASFVVTSAKECSSTGHALFNCCWKILYTAVPDGEKVVLHCQKKDVLHCQEKVVLSCQEKVVLHCQEKAVLHCQEKVVLCCQEKVVLHCQEKVVLHCQEKVVLYCQEKVVLDCQEEGQFQQWLSWQRLWRIMYISHCCDSTLYSETVWCNVVKWWLFALWTSCINL